MNFGFTSYMLTAMLVIFSYGIVTRVLADDSSIHLNNQEIVSLIEHLGDGIPGDTNEAVSKLLEIGNPVIPYLTEILDEPPSYNSEGGLIANHWKRLRTAHCLSMLNAENVSKILIREIQRDKNPQMRFIYILYLSRHDQNEAVRALVEEMKKGETTVNDIAVTLKNMNNPFCIPLLEPLLKDSRTDIRFGAADVLASLGDKSGYDILLAELDNPKYELRAALALPATFYQSTLFILKSNINHSNPDINQKINDKIIEIAKLSGEVGMYFPRKAYKPFPLPTYENAKELLPIPIIDDEPKWLEMYDFCWNIAFSRLKAPMPGSPFVSNYIDEGFGPNIFQWDTHFMIMFWKYAYHIFPSIESHNNFYTTQEADGYICREIREVDGTPFYFRGKDNTINPPLFAWLEYEYYRFTGDDSRFSMVLPVLEYYMNWIEKNRKYSGVQHGLYWQTNLGSGMDNSLRVGTGWVDISSQMVMSYSAMANMESRIGANERADEYRKKAQEITDNINKWMWNEQDGLYYDVHDFGEQLPVKTVACFWPMWAGLASNDQAERLAANLLEPRTFWRPFPYPSLAADQPAYFPSAGYWLGGVWAPTNYMIIRGLERYGYHKQAYETGIRFLRGMDGVFAKTGSVWENYNPESITEESKRANKDFVGWTGLGPISILIETIIGIEADAQSNTVTWNIKRTDRHGIKNLRFGSNILTMIAKHRNSNIEEVSIHIKSSKPFKLILVREQNRQVFEISAGESTLMF